MKKLSPIARERITLPDIDREYTLYEIATITSAGPARALGLTSKGSLGIGTDADIVIYEEEKDIAKMFSHPRYVLKGGEVVIEDGDIRATPEGREFIVKPSFNPDIESFLKPKFEDVYTMSFENYPVEIERIEHAEVRDCIDV